MSKLRKTLAVCSAVAVLALNVQSANAFTIVKGGSDAPDPRSNVIDPKAPADAPQLQMGARPFDGSASPFGPERQPSDEHFTFPGMNNHLNAADNARILQYGIQDPFQSPRR